VKPRSTAHYQKHRDDPQFLRRRRDYARLYREQHADPDTPAAIFARAYEVGCSVCGERARECLGLWPLAGRRPLTLRATRVKAMSPGHLRQALSECVCLCANCRAKYEAGHLGLPHWVPEEHRWR
jgi:hypothetical protein